MSKAQPRILITGASGHLGTQVLNHLIETYGYPADRIVATSRTPEHLSRWAGLGAEVRKADFSEPAGLADSFRGAEKLLLISADSPDNGTRLKQHLQAVEAAKEAGVGHVIYTSLPQAAESLVTFAPVHLGTENATKASGMKWTILRNSWYFENLLTTIPAALASGKLYTAAERGAISYISRSDVGRATAAALIATTGVEDKTFTLTGTEALDWNTVAEQVSRVLNKPIEVVQVPLEALVEGLQSHGLPEPIAVMVASFDTAAKAGNLALVTADFEKLTGATPERFGPWLAENKDLFSPK